LLASRATLLAGTLAGHPNFCSSTRQDLDRRSCSWQRFAAPANDLFLVGDDDQTITHGDCRRGILGPRGCRAPSRRLSHQPSLPASSSPGPAGCRHTGALRHGSCRRPALSAPSIAARSD
jgi:hypothetical protein